MTTKKLNFPCMLKQEYEYMAIKTLNVPWHSPPDPYFNPLTTNVSHHIETSQLTCTANQLTGFYMMRNTDR